MDVSCWDFPQFLFFESHPRLCFHIDHSIVDGRLRRVFLRDRVRYIVALGLGPVLVPIKVLSNSGYRVFPLPVMLHCRVKSAPFLWLLRVGSLG